jgi:hypothetical protein
VSGANGAWEKEPRVEEDEQSGSFLCSSGSLLFCECVRRRRRLFSFFHFLCSRPIKKTRLDFSLSLPALALLLPGALIATTNIAFCSLRPISPLQTENTPEDKQRERKTQNMATMIPDAAGSVRGDDEDSIIRHRLPTHTSSARGEPPLNKVAKA